MAMTAFGDDLARLIVDLALKGTIILVLGMALARLSSRRSQAWGSVIWLATFIALTLIPMTSLWRYEVGISPFSPLAKGALFFGEFLVPQEQSYSPAPLQPEAAAGLHNPAKPPRQNPPPSSPAARASAAQTPWWPLPLAGLYALGVAHGLYRLGRNLRISARISSSAEPGDALPRVDHWRRRLRIARHVPLVLSTEVSSPATLGLFAPLIAIPRALAARCDERQIDHILVHELAHIKRRDALVQAFSSLVVALYWFNPLAHLAQRSLVAAREYACDDWVVETLGDQAGYAETLMAATVQARPGLGIALGVCMAQTSNISTRIERVLQERRAVRPRADRKIALLAVLVVALTGAAVGGAHPVRERWNLLADGDRALARGPRIDIGGRPYRVFWMPETVAPGHGRGALNASGQVAINATARAQYTRSGLWAVAADETSAHLDLLTEGQRWSYASAVSAAGAVTGGLFAPWDDDSPAARYGGLNRFAQPFLWTAARGLVPIPTLGGTQVAPMDVNDRGEVVGWALTADGDRVPFYYDGVGASKALSGRVGFMGSALAVNADGVVVGDITDETHGYRTAPFMWSAATGMVLLDLPPEFGPSNDELQNVIGRGETFGSGGSARDINDRGQVLVNMHLSKPDYDDQRKYYVLNVPYVWSAADGYTRLPSLPGRASSSGEQINNRGEVLLSARDNPGDWRTATDYLVRDGELVELPQLPGGEWTRYTALNDRGWFAGRVVDFTTEKTLAPGYAPYTGSRLNREIKRERARGFIAKPLGE